MPVNLGGSIQPDLNSNSNSNSTYAINAAPKVAIIVGNLWQAHGGMYGQYFTLINSLSIPVLVLLRIYNWAPWIQEPARAFFWSSLKNEFDALSLWQTGKLETHHQYLVTFFFLCSASRRFGGTWQCSPQIQTLWYGPLVRLASRACTYTVLFAMCFQYSRLSLLYIILGLLVFIVSRAYEVFYPWLDMHCPASPLRLSEQMKTAMTEFDKEASESLLASPATPWSGTFHNVTHSRLHIFRSQLESIGLFLPLSVLKDNPSLLDNLLLSRYGWVEGSGMVDVGGMVALLFGVVGLAMAEDTPFLLKLGLGSLFFQGFLLTFLISMPAFTFHLEKLALAIHPPSSNPNPNHDHDHKDGIQEEAPHLHSWRAHEQHQLWWAEIKSFLNSLITFGFPFQYHRTFFESPLSTCLLRFLALLEGIELALFISLAACLKFALHFSLYAIILLIKKSSTRLRRCLSLLCRKLKSLLIRYIVVRIGLPGLHSITIHLLNAEIALASQKVCPRGHCITTIRLDEILRELEDIVKAKGQVEEASNSSIFVHPHAAEESLELPEEEELKHRAIALGLMQSATCAVQKLMGSLDGKGEGASTLHSLLRLLRVYCLDSIVSSEKAKTSMIGVANLVQTVLRESMSGHWVTYQELDRVEANYCGCISEAEWVIMVAQLHVAMLLVYVGWRISSMQWPYELSESESVRNWVNTRFADVNIVAGATECNFLFLRLT